MSKIPVYGQAESIPGQTMYLIRIESAKQAQRRQHLNFHIDVSNKRYFNWDISFVWVILTCLLMVITNISVYVVFVSGQLLSNPIFGINACSRVDIWR